MAGAQLFRQFDLTEAQFNVLYALRNKERKVTQSDLSKRLVVTRASITSVLDKLEAKGLVERQDVPGNRRINLVELTPGGVQLIDQVEPLYRQAIHKATGDLTEKESKALVRLLERVRIRTRETMSL
jgi:MarR family 2-MHQ and catechol resistance regulon transcriptional repressor